MSAAEAPEVRLPRLAAPGRRALDAAGIANLSDLAKHSKREIEALHGIGPNALATLEGAMRENGLAFK